MKYASKAQEKFMFAVHPEIARKIAHQSGQHHGKKGSVTAFRRLPSKKTKSKPATTRRRAALARAHRKHGK